MKNYNQDTTVHQAAQAAIFEAECIAFYQHTSVTAVLGDVVIWIKHIGSEIRYWLIAEYGTGEDYLTSSFADAVSALTYALS